MANFVTAAHIAHCCTWITASHIPTGGLEPPSSRLWGWAIWAMRPLDPKRDKKRTLLHLLLTLTPSYWLILTLTYSYLLSFTPTYFYLLLPAPLGQKHKTKPISDLCHFVLLHHLGPLFKQNSQCLVGVFCGRTKNDVWNNVASSWNWHNQTNLAKKISSRNTIVFFRGRNMDN